jgi:hypothetical protein
MGTAVGLEAHAAVDGFTPQHDKVRAANCQLAKTVAEMVVDVGIQAGVMGVNLGQFSGALGAMSARADKLMAQAKISNNYKQAVRASQQLNMARNSMYYTQWGTGVGRKGQSAGQQLHDAHYNAKGSQVPEREIKEPRLEFPMIKGHGLCGNVFGVIEDNAGAQVDQLVAFVNEQLHGLRYSVEQLFNSLFIKDQGDLGDVALQDIMDLKEWSGESTRFYADLEVSVLHPFVLGISQLTRDRKVKAAIRNIMISELMAASRQYLKCEERDDAVEICKQDKKLAAKKRGSLYCPPDHPKLRCQAGMWTKRQIFNHEKELPAFKEGEKSSTQGIELSDLFSNSLERYFVMGTDSFTPRGLYGKGRVIDPLKMAHLPVAVSKVRTVHPGHHGKGFPFSCGDWTSDCTAAFMDRINVNIADEWETRSTALVRVSSTLLYYHYA